MTPSLKDRFSGLATAPATEKKRTQLGRLLGAEVRQTAYGEHLVVRKSLAPKDTEFLTNEVVSAHSFLPVLLRSKNALCPAEQWLFLDTETTGLAGGTGTYVFMVGLAQVPGRRIELEQFFMRDFREESSMLADVATRFAGKSLLVTFNGKAFDWPLLETRYRMQRMRLESAPVMHLDLLHPSRHLWRAQLGSASLGELERGVLGIRRVGDVPGERIPRIYFDYVRGGEAEPMVGVFRHNENDLVALVRLTAKMLRLLAPPSWNREASGREELSGENRSKPSALESYGLSRLFDLAGWREAAREHYERAVAAELPEELGRAARRALAWLHKRERNFDRAMQLWEELIDDLADAPGALLEAIRAYEQLAIYYEHHAGEPQRAAQLTREALAELGRAVRTGQIEPSRGRRLRAQFEHRLARLIRIRKLQFHGHFLEKTLYPDSV